MTKNFTMINIGGLSDGFVKDKRIMVGEQLGLTGCEVSFKYVQTGEATPFAHSHKLNEEVYIILSGSNDFMLDNDEFDIKEGMIIRVASEGERALKASDEESLSYLCVQAQTNSLTQATKEDGKLGKLKAFWMGQGVHHEK